MEWTRQSWGRRGASSSPTQPLTLPGLRQEEPDLRRCGEHSMGEGAPGGQDHGVSVSWGARTSGSGTRVGEEGAFPCSPAL